MRKSLLFGVLAVVLALIGPSGSPAWAEATVAPSVTGRFSLIDQDGRPVTEASYAGHLRMMTFGYTFCPDICPTTLAVMAAAIQRLGPDAARVIPIFVTVDPKRDTPARLKEYVAAFDPRFAGLSGTQEAVARAAYDFRVRYHINSPEASDPDLYTVDHSAGIYIMDGDGHFLAKLPHQLEADDIAERVRAYLR